MNLRLVALSLFQALAFRLLSTSLRVSHACRVARARPKTRPRIVVRDGQMFLEGGGVVSRITGGAWEDAIREWTVTRGGSA